MIGQTPSEPDAVDPAVAPGAPAAIVVPDTPVAEEIGGRGGLDPVRYGDWEKNGRCIDF